MTQIHFLGRLADIAGGQTRDLALPENVVTIFDLRAWLLASDPELGAAVNAPAIRAIVDDVIAAESQVFSHDAVLAFLPTYSGG
jgi:molybdopterin converting factor small subunit